MTQPENAEINPFESPIEYFEVQVRFAQKWAEISGASLPEILLTKTDLYRSITDSEATKDEISEEWSSLVSGLTEDSDTTAVTQRLYDAYTHHPHSIYKDAEQSSAFSHAYYPDTKIVKIHFSNPKRGEKPLSDENMAKRRAEFQALLELVRVDHPEAALLMSATWLRSTAHYRSLSPPDIADTVSLMSQDMKFSGNSVWGQFVDASGNVNERVYDAFMQNIEAATSMDELLEAFPYKTIRAVAPIDAYYDYYGLDTHTAPPQ